MIYLEEEETKRLKELGFKPPYESEDVNAYQYYSFNNTEWSIGGRITGEDLILAPEEVYKEGIRLYTIDEIFDWIHIEGYGMKLVKNIGSGFKFTISDRNGKEYKGTGGTLTRSIFNTMEKLLMTINKED
ncbi:MAG TPA: hypothetical protein DEF35_22685 [Paenibacillus sp.]|jgi:hypothetical protein|uniref:hypothetical protein n=1 Tax=Paenibacillus TaxID=44249 RepID=UPI000BA1241D|nr:MULTISPECIES: hypothetical protein [Paenibacillus]OZQ68176.1 hypothetical protein CA599_16305 [Paenibacillus taichungensis]HBU84424.1 hypothetical protein [Paenibacillus sp.]